MSENENEDKAWSIDSRAVHSGEPRVQPHSCLITPVALSATYTFQDTAELVAFFEGDVERQEYGRYGNPTTDVAEEKIAALDGSEAACLFSSGMAAMTTTLLAMLRAGQHIVMTDDCYRRTRQLIGTILSRYGITHTQVPAGDLAAMEAAIQPGVTRLLVAESPTNPYLNVEDLEGIAALAKRHRLKSVIDSTFATPINQRPFEFGIDLVMHSATKYLSGHNDVLAGSVSGRRGIISAIREFRDVMGAILDPHAAFMLTRGMKTLHLRVARQNASALAIAQFLEGHPKVARVYYPGLESHPQHAIAKAQMTGFGGVVSFEIDGDCDRTSRFIDACRIPRIAPSLGGVESLIEQPALMSYYEMTTEQREAIGIRDSLVRYAIGVEGTEDLVADVRQALASV